MNVDEKTVEMIAQLVAETLGTQEGVNPPANVTTEAELLAKYHPYSIACPFPK